METMKQDSPYEMDLGETFKMIDDKVLVAPWDIADKTDSGIILPDSMKEKEREKNRKGTVIAVGPGHRSDSTNVLHPVEVKPGDDICFERLAGTEVEIKGVKYLVMNEMSILATLPPLVG
jgi:chaperonin GroES